MKSSSSSRARGGRDARSQTPRCSVTPIRCMHRRSWTNILVENHRPHHHHHHPPSPPSPTPPHTHHHPPTHPPPPTTTQPPSHPATTHSSVVGRNTVQTRQTRVTDTCVCAALLPSRTRWLLREGRLLRSPFLSVCDRQCYTGLVAAHLLAFLLHLDMDGVIILIVMMRGMEFFASVFVQEHSCSDSLCFHFHIQSNLYVVL